MFRRFGGLRRINGSRSTFRNARWFSASTSTIIKPPTPRFGKVVLLFGSTTAVFGIGAAIGLKLNQSKSIEDDIFRALTYGYRPPFLVYLNENLIRRSIDYQFQYRDDQDESVMVVNVPPAMTTVSIESIRKFYAGRFVVDMTDATKPTADAFAAELKSMSPILNNSKLDTADILSKTAVAMDRRQRQTRLRKPVVLMTIPSASAVDADIIRQLTKIGFRVVVITNDYTLSAKIRCYPLSFRPEDADVNKAEWYLQKSGIVRRFPSATDIASTAKSIGNDSAVLGRLVDWSLANPTSEIKNWLDAETYRTHLIWLNAVSTLADFDRSAAIRMANQLVFDDRHRLERSYVDVFRQRFGEPHLVQHLIDRGLLWKPDAASDPYASPIAVLAWRTHTADALRGKQK